MSGNQCGFYDFVPFQFCFLRCLSRWIFWGNLWWPLLSNLVVVALVAIIPNEREAGQIWAIPEKNSFSKSLYSIWSPPFYPCAHQSFLRWTWRWCCDSQQWNDNRQRHCRSTSWFVSHRLSRSSPVGGSWHIIILVLLPISIFVVIYKFQSKLTKNLWLS